MLSKVVQSVDGRSFRLIPCQRELTREPRYCRVTAERCYVSAYIVCGSQERPIALLLRELGGGWAVHLGVVEVGADWTPGRGTPRRFIPRPGRDWTGFACVETALRVCGRVRGAARPSWARRPAYRLSERERRQLIFDRVVKLRRGGGV